jgi:hypothetical protein
MHGKQSQNPINQIYYPSQNMGTSISGKKLQDILNATCLQGLFHILA